MRKVATVAESSHEMRHVATVAESVEDAGMEDMIEALVENVLPDEAIPKKSKARDKMEDFVRKTCKEPLYVGANVSKLRTMLSILNLQATFGWSNASVSALFELLHKILPEGNNMPQSRDEARKTLATVGLDYNIIHACPNDCVLYRGDIARLEHCPKCKAPRYRKDVQGNEVPSKVLRHFPLIPRIRHMFRCKSIASLMTWHVSGKSKDDKLRVPADCKAWKHIDAQWPEFGQEPRNLRLGLSTDGVNPFGQRSTKWSTWPVLLVNYNIPPWLCIKKGHMILSLIIPGKRKPKNLQVYLAPLIEELQALWNGIEVEDRSRVGMKRKFDLRAILMWTMHDYPGYGDVSGLSVSGHYACPPCGTSLQSRRSLHLNKNVYEGHKKYYDVNNPKRQNVTATKPKVWGAKEWYEHWENHASIRIRKVPGMKCLNCFHVLPYWHTLLITHLLDPMHIFKNVATIVWEHIMGKRDNFGARKDLETMQQMASLWVDEHGEMPQAPWVLNNEEQARVKQTIESFRTPTGAMRSLKGCFTLDDDLTGLKTHDWHKILQVWIRNMIVMMPSYMYVY